MKKLLLFILVSCSLLQTSAQTIEYFNSDWKKISNKNKASYYRLITYNSNGTPAGVVKDFYITGEPQWQGVIAYIDKSGTDVYQGWCTWFHRNGQFQKQSFYRQGMLDSTTYYWDENGTLLREEDYKNNRLHGAWIQYYPDGKLHYYAAYNNGEMISHCYLDYDEAGKATMTFHETFQDNRFKWGLSKGKDYSVDITPGKLSLKAEASLRFGSYQNLPLPANNNFSLEANIQFDKGDEKGGHGIVWGFQDWDNYDYFEISGNGYFQTGSMIKGIDVPTNKWTYTQSLNRGKGATNQIKVMKEGEEYLFIVNTQLVGRAKFIDMAGKFTGVFTSSGVKTIHFTKLLVKYDADPNATATQKLPPKSEWLGNGSGILIDKTGLVATNYHVIQDARVIEIDFTRNGKKYSFAAQVFKTDPQHDLAILKITDKKYDAFKPAELLYGVRPSSAPTGSAIFALGYPMASILGDEIKFTDGRISAGSGMMGDTVTYQISVPIQPGNSGGPLFDQDGNLIGITNAKALMETQNVSYAIKIAWLLKLAGTTYMQPKNAIKLKRMEDKVNILSSFVPMIKIK